MVIDVLKRVALFVAFVLAQATVFGHIHLFGVATPLVYVWFAAKFPKGYPRWGILLWCFFLGLSVDIFSNTPGVAASALTLLGALQPGIFQLFMPRDADDNPVASAATFGLGKFTSYVTILVLVYCLVFFSLETFSFFDPVGWSLCVVSSTVFTLVLVMVLESVRRSP